MPERIICLVPRLSGIGGMVSFRQKLEKGLIERGYTVCDSLSASEASAVLVIGGTRQISGLVRARRKGALIVQRLDGMNWIHRLGGTGVRHFLRAEYGNLLLRFIRARLADRLVYQSGFARRWWEEKHGALVKPTTVIYNGVDLEVFSPAAEAPKIEGQVRLLMVEGSLQGGYEFGLESACQLLVEMAKASDVAHSQYRVNAIELTVVGKVSEAIRLRWESWVNERSLPLRVSVIWAGAIPNERIPEVDRAAHLFFSGDVNAACPNAVIEAMACGTPIIAYDTGALPELIGQAGGRVVPYGGDPWRLEKQDSKQLASNAWELLGNLKRYQSGARMRAVELFDINRMVDAYLEVLDL
jgi:glycosyltransferase involved in cell wall biosynthesis